MNRLLLLITILISYKSPSQERNKDNNITRRSHSRSLKNIIKSQLIPSLYNLEKKISFHLKNIYTFAL